MIAALPLLAADWEGLLRLLIFIVFIAVAGINQLLKAAREQRAKRPPVPNGADDDVRRNLANELEEFLRRAQGKTTGSPKPPPPPRESTAEQSSLSKAEKKRRRRAQQATARGEPVTAEVVEPAPQHRRLEPRLEKHIDTSRFEERARHLTQIEHEADDIDSHVHQVFEHQLGSLGERTQVESDQAPVVVSAERAASSAGAIAALLNNPQSLQQAIIMQEILSRPEHRW